MQTTNKIEKLKQTDLQSPDNFRQWIKKNLNNLYQEKEVLDEHLLIYLDYIEKTISEIREIDRPYWLKVVRELKSNLESIKRNNNDL